jgi:cytochrome P450 family 4
MSIEVESLGSVAFNATALLIGLLLPVLGLWYTYYRLSRRHLYELAEKIPGPSGFPFVGNLFEFLGGPDSQYNFKNIK